LMTTEQISPANVAPIGLFHRRELYELLLNKVGRENIQGSKKLIAISLGQLCFEDGSSAVADMVVGCDGIFSKVRQIIFPDRQLRESGVICSRGMVDYVNSSIANDIAYVFSGQQSRVVTYTTDRHTQQKYWFAARAARDKEEMLTKEAILHYFADYTQDVVNMIEKTPHDNIISSRLYELEPLSSWSRDNVTLLGDACCAALPSMAIGFSLGLENAFILAQCIASNYADVTCALHRYEYRCLIRSNTLMKITAQLNELVYNTGVTAEKVQPLYQAFFHEINQSPF
jgi:FAD-dependent urate hydroxylase